MSRLNPGLDAREKLPPMVAEPEMTASSLHGAMMSPARSQVKSRAHPSPLSRIARLGQIKLADELAGGLAAQFAPPHAAEDLVALRP